MCLIPRPNQCIHQTVILPDYFYDTLMPCFNIYIYRWSAVVREPAVSNVAARSLLMNIHKLNTPSVLPLLSLSGLSAVCQAQD